MRRRSFSIPVLEYHDELGSIIGTTEFSYPDLRDIARNGFELTAEKIEENISFIKMIVDNYNIIGKWLVMLVSIIGFIGFICGFIASILQ